MSTATSPWAAPYTSAIFQLRSTSTSSGENRSARVSLPQSSHHRSSRHGPRAVRSLHLPHRLPSPRHEIRKHLQVFLAIRRVGRTGAGQRKHPGPLRSRHFEGNTPSIQSSTLVIAYLMKRKSCGFKEAISFVRQARPNVCPNLGFERQLKEYELFLNKQAEFGF